MSLSLSQSTLVFGDVGPGGSGHTNRLSLSQSTLVFGDVGPGGSGHTNLTFHLINLGLKDKVFFQCMFRSLAGAFFTVDSCEGFVSPRSKFPVKVTLNLPGSMMPGNIYDRLVILTKDGATPLAVDLLASVHFDAVLRPPLLMRKHMSSLAACDWKGVFEDLAFTNPTCPLQLVSQESGVVDFGKLTGKVIIDQTLKVQELIFRNSSDKSILVNFSTGNLRLDEYLAVSLSSDFLEIQARAEAVLSLKLLKLGNEHVERIVVGRLDVSVCFKGDGHYLTADSETLTPPWTFKLLILADFRKQTPVEPNVSVSDKVVKMPACFPGNTSFRVIQLDNHEATVVHYSVSLSGAVGFALAPAVGFILPGSSALLGVSFSGGSADGDGTQISRDILNLDFNGIGDPLKIPLVATICARPGLSAVEISRSRMRQICQ
jgi:hypothetical protein